ncbi:MAG: ribonuclease J, partial [Candidatus Andersenbacteria bacterium]|nr:ribonuclease J [Candidatus Andersenbacteria bacterium]
MIQTKQQKQANTQPRKHIRFSSKQITQQRKPVVHPVRSVAQQTKKLRIIPLGGLEEVGRNMTLFEYGNDIIIIDMGLQFPEEDMPGIDYIIPNIKYLKGKERNIKGVFITHGHMDHIGAIPHLMPRLGNPPMFTAALTAGIIKKKQEDYPNVSPLNIKVVNFESRVNLGNFKVEFFHVNHNIPDVLGMAIYTPEGLIIHTGDFKFDHSPTTDKPADIGRIAQLGSQNVLALMSDSTGAEHPGHSISEQEIQKTIDGIISKAKGRIIVATFSSLISRIQQVITISEKYGRKVAIDGYSMRTNIEIANKLGYLKFRKGTIIRPEQMKNYPDDKISLMCTGAQGEGRAVLMRIVNKEHRHVQIKKADTVIFSSSVVPGNERTVQNLKDQLYRQGADVVHYKMMDVHVGGHAQIEDLKMMINLIKPKFFIPIHGNFYMLRLHANIAENLGIPPSNTIVAGNGNVIEMTKNNAAITKEKIPSNYVMVDGLGVGDVGNVVLRDRQQMSEDGMFTIVVIVDSKTGKIVGSPDIISRGFIYMKGSTELVKETKNKVAEIVNKKAAPEHDTNWAYIKDNIRDQIGQFLFNKTQRRPMILPVV